MCILGDNWKYEPQFIFQSMTAPPMPVPNIQHRKGHDLDSLKKIWNNIHLKHESKESKQREQKILLSL